MSSDSSCPQSLGPQTTTPRLNDLPCVMYGNPRSTTAVVPGSLEFLLPDSSHVSLSISAEPPSKVEGNFRQRAYSLGEKTPAAQVQRTLCLQPSALNARSTPDYRIACRYAASGKDYATAKSRDSMHAIAVFDDVCCLSRRQSRDSALLSAVSYWNDEGNGDGGTASAFCDI